MSRPSGMIRIHTAVRSKAALLHKVGSQAGEHSHERPEQIVACLA